MDLQRAKEIVRSTFSGFFSDYSFDNPFGHARPDVVPPTLTPGQKLIFGIIAANCLVTVLWHVPALKAHMMRWFTNSFAQSEWF